TAALWAVAQADAGDLDPSFNQTGKFTFSFTDTTTQANGIALQGDGKIVLAITFSAANGGYFALLRLKPDGTLDPDFAGGLVAISPGGSANAQAVAIQQDGRIVAAGAVASGPTLRFIVMRFNPAGAADPSFDQDGIASIDFGPGPTAYAQSLALQQDGKIVLAGAVSDGTHDDFALARLNSDGTLDPTFGTGGKVTTDFGGAEEAATVAVQRDGRIVVAG